MRDVVGKSGFGIGSAGLPAYNVLVEGYSQALDNDVVLTMKQANVPAVSRFVDSGAVEKYFEHEGHRTVVSQRALQVHTDPLLGYTQVDGRGYVVAEVSPYEYDLDWSSINEPDDMRPVVRALGQATAKVHCASDEDSEQNLVTFQTEEAICAVLEGRRKEFVADLTDFAIDYAVTVRKDHALFVDAFREGRIGGVDGDASLRRRLSSSRRAPSLGGLPLSDCPACLSSRAFGVTAAGDAASSTAIDPVLGDQRDRRAPEPAAGHPRAESAVLLRGRHDQVELLAGHLEVVAQGRVRAQEQLAEPRHVAALEARDRRVDAGDLGDHVAGPATEPLVGQRRQRLLEVVDLGQVRDAEQPGGRLAVLTPRGVAAVVECVVHPGVHDQQPQPGRLGVPRHLPVRTVGEVEEQRVPGGRVHGDALVHAARGRARHLVLRADAGGDHALPDRVVEVDPGGLQRGQGHRALQRGRARQARADRHPAVEDQVDARHVDPVRAQRPEDTGDVADPAGDGAGTERLEASRPRLVHLQAAHRHGVVVPGGGRDVRAVGERVRQAPPAVVVDVLADQVHAARRHVDAVGGPAVHLGEPCGEVGGDALGVARVEEVDGHGPKRGTPAREDGRPVGPGRGSWTRTSRDQSSPWRSANHGQ